MNQTARVTEGQKNIYLKNVLLSLLILIVSGIPAHAQLIIEPYVGITASSTTGAQEDDFFTPEFLAKWHSLYGLAVEQRFNHKIGIKAAIQWVEIGGINKILAQSYPTYEVKLDYIQPSVNISYYITERLYADAGLYTGVLNKAIVDRSRGRTPPPHRELVEVTNSLRKWDAGLLIAFGTRY